MCTPKIIQVQENLKSLILLVNVSLNPLDSFI